MASVAFSRRVLRAVCQSTQLLWQDASVEDQVGAWSKARATRLEDRVLVLVQLAIVELLRRFAGRESDLEAPLADLRDACRALREEHISSSSAAAAASSSRGSADKFLTPERPSVGEQDGSVEHFSLESPEQQFFRIHSPNVSPEKAAVESRPSSAGSHQTPSTAASAAASERSLAGGFLPALRRASLQVFGPLGLLEPQSAGDNDGVGGTTASNADSAAAAATGSSEPVAMGPQSFESRRRLASACEAFADVLTSALQGVEALDSGVLEAATLQKVLLVAVSLQRSLAAFRELAASSPAVAQRAPAASAPLPLLGTGFDDEVVAAACTERLVLDLHRFVNGLYGTSVRSRTSEWVTHLTRLPTSQEEGAGLLREAAGSPFAGLRLLALHALWFHHLAVADELQALGFLAAAADAGAEAFFVEQTIMREFPCKSRLSGPQLGLQTFLATPRPGANRLDSRLLWAVPGERGAQADRGPSPALLEELASATPEGALPESESCDCRLRAVWEAALLHLQEWDLTALAELLPLMLQDAKRFLKTSGVARGCARNGGMLLASLHAYTGEDAARDACLDDVQELVSEYEAEGRVRTLLRCEMLRARPAHQGAASLALAEDLYRYHLLPGFQAFGRLAADLAGMLTTCSDGDRELLAALSAPKKWRRSPPLPASSPPWLAEDIEMASHLWLGVLARHAGRLRDAEGLLRMALKLSEETTADIPNLYHGYVAWTELMCVQVQSCRWSEAKRSCRFAEEALQREVRRAAGRGEAPGGWGERLVGVAVALGESMEIPMITLAHPSHPRCPLFFWQTSNLLHRAALEIRARQAGPLLQSGEVDSSDSESSGGFEGFEEQGALSGMSVASFSTSSSSSSYLSRSAGQSTYSGV
eukprot:TRINITY_DN744_c0_g4_i1.p1 TRINITY_DN744_c0_g4~~TRINITY_DN744_c0_g4_i1.p1  ORF type:complete len:881 (+),score=198.30 TRINITY_DN744_c0_g4_i1:171-2813(+)